MTGSSTGGAILFATIPVTVMLIIEVILPYWRNRRRDGSSRQKKSIQTRRDVAFTGEDVDATGRRVSQSIAPPADNPSAPNPLRVIISGGMLLG